MSVKDSNGTELHNGDNVTVIKDLKEIEFKGVEDLLTKRARAGSYEIKGLESPETLLSYLVKAVPEQEQLLNNTSLRVQQVQLLKSSLAYYKKGNVEEFCKVTEKLHTPETREQFAKRNDPIADKIENLMNSEGKRVFVAVGAAHLFFDNNLVEILQKRGWTVTSL